MTVLIAEGMHKSGLDLLESAGISVADLSADSFSASDVRAIVVRSVFKINEKTLADYPALKVVAKLGTGLDNIDQDFCRQQNITVLSAPTMNSVSTAEFTVMQILAFYKKAYALHDAVCNRDYRRHLFAGRELSGLTAGLIGYGSVGKNVAERLVPFVKKILVCDPKNTPCKGEKMDFVQNVEALLDSADMVILAVSLKGNENRANSDFLSRLKSDVLLVNAARGALIDEPALCSFLKKNPDAFYYCDVIKEEPDYKKSPAEQDYRNALLDLPNVLFTPHVASMTLECQEHIAVDIAQKLIGQLQ